MILLLPCALYTIPVQIKRRQKFNKLSLAILYELEEYISMSKKG